MARIEQQGPASVAGLLLGFLLLLLDFFLSLGYLFLSLPHLLVYLFLGLGRVVAGLSHDQLGAVEGADLRGHVLPVADVGIGAAIGLGEEVSVGYPQDVLGVADFEAGDDKELFGFSVTGYRSAACHVPYEVEVEVFE